MTVSNHMFFNSLEIFVLSAFRVVTKTLSEFSSASMAAVITTPLTGWGWGFVLCGGKKTYKLIWDLVFLEAEFSTNMFAVCPHVSYAAL